MNDKVPPPTFNPGYPELHPTVTFNTQSPYVSNPDAVPFKPVYEIPVGAVIIQPREQKICGHCMLPFKEYDRRTGISSGILILIIIVSLFILPFILALLCCCEIYKVCPNCGNFTGHPESKDEGTCLC